MKLFKDEIILFRENKLQIIYIAGFCSRLCCFFSDFSGSCPEIRKSLYHCCAFLNEKKHIKIAFKKNKMRSFLNEIIFYKNEKMILDLGTDCDECCLNNKFCSCDTAPGWECCDVDESGPYYIFKSLK